MPTKSHCKELKYLIKWTIYGILFGLFSMLVTLGSGMFSNELPIFNFGALLIGKMWDNLFQDVRGEPAWGFLLIYSSYFILYALTGALVGFIICKIKTKK
ncbi:hypothetical protein HYV80_06750 [Candidatus Woesearchaeota archaeon]|nr:hypothetical protein [Candidatus Woesearchaeota archaeon]